jgi:hypothetical protein
MKRIALVPYETDVNGLRTPTIPAAATGFITLHDFGPRALVKMTLPDGTAKTATTIADITIDQDGRQVEVNAEPLSAAQQTTAKNFLIGQGFDVSQFDGDAVNNRAKLLRFVLRRLAGWQDMTPRELLDSWDVG